MLEVELKLGPSKCKDYNAVTPLLLVLPIYTLDRNLYIDRQSPVKSPDIKNIIVITLDITAREPSIDPSLSHIYKDKQLRSKR